MTYRVETAMRNCPSFQLLAKSSRVHSEILARKEMGKQYESSKSMYLRIYPRSFYQEGTAQSLYPSFLSGGLDCSFPALR